ncbi:ead/Ea22-like family protein [Escherichia coli]|uniref:ead/Ea22-like family protein n=3 Tax=Escherichia coli TaxID=562 RepID=UPI0017D93ABF|nr:ead/Ea22-like family protein [Escherichia coli]EFK4080050.1 ead/Ea22-like family protein [Escherichia coli]EGB5760072.1 ead/Ea22-like family protein [Escherichia coli]EGH5803127.1 ead/Ea22-like family protein [Escherichia coli]EGJ4407403.1 ead/Ea22-like family protein [Escherichia coli]EGT2601065.1 ead/Ea22-like family protein [Escherichia coli]
MSGINYQMLRDKAENATKGGYIVGHTSVNQHGNLTGVFVCQKWKGEPGGVIAECHVNCLVETDAQAYANAEFIAAFNPNVALALLDEREAKDKVLSAQDNHINQQADRIESLEKKNGELGRALEAAEKRIAELEAREIKPAKGEVLVVVSGFTGCGKSAIAGEIEIAMKAIGVPVQWTNGDAEKRMTGADWLTAIEMYKPTVRIVEVNVPRATGIRIKGE